MTTCKNCGKETHDRFCSHCGQRTDTGRITFDTIWGEIFHFFTHLEHGFLMTSIRMITHPGKTVVSYIEGQRKTYQPPISYFLIWTTAYILLLLGIEHLFGENRVINYREYFGPEATTRYAISHLNMVLMFLIPFQSFYFYVLVTRKRYNYFETMAAGIYAIGTVILFQFVFALLALFFHFLGTPPADLRISDGFKVGYMSWFIYSLMNQFQIKHKGLLIPVLLILTFGTFTLWRLYGIPAILGPLA